MDGHHQAGRRGQSEPGASDNAAIDPHTITVLRRYSAGALSAREAARELGPVATQHDVFAGVVAAGLKLPEPPPDQVAREIAAMQAFFPRG
jgi:hypothetical protein